MSGASIQGTIALTYKVEASPAVATSEGAPREGAEYILFLAAPRSGRYSVIKTRKT